MVSPTVKEEDEQDDFWGVDELEVLQGDGTDFMSQDEEDEWIPDAIKAQRKPKPTHLTPANEVIVETTKIPQQEKTKKDASPDDDVTNKDRPSPYTEDEEELIEAMGGKTKTKTKTTKGGGGSNKREDGFLGDCTLKDIAMDYSVPISYLADVLCMWGVPVPINIDDRLGDMVTGEQAFALVEAVNSLDVGALQDRYSNYNMLQVCDEFEISLKDAFEFAMKEGWSLPFGVRTNLRVEQEDELLRVFSDMYGD